MAETYIFNTSNVKTEELNTKKISIYPGYGNESERVDLLSLFQEYSYPFKVEYDRNNLVEGVYASGWFNASALTDGKIKLNGVEYNSNNGVGNNIGEKFADVINKEEYAPVTATSSFKEAVAAYGWFVPQYLSDKTIIIDNVEYVLETTQITSIATLFVDYLNSISTCPVSASLAGNRVSITAKTSGASGNNITIACKGEPTNSGVLSGSTLEEGEDSAYIVTLTAKDIGEEGNTVFIESVAAPSIDNWYSGEELSGGRVERQGRSPGYMGKARAG
jgi:hypothetical protein